VPWRRACRAIPLPLSAACPAVVIRDSLTGDA
jgi:hypothetical protein